MPINHRSGRIVVDVDPEVKLALYTALLAQGTSMKDWFLRCAQRTIAKQDEPPRSEELPSVEEGR